MATLIPVMVILMWGPIAGRRTDAAPDLSSFLLGKGPRPLTDAIPPVLDNVMFEALTRVVPDWTPPGPENGIDLATTIP
jgi:hypothetical protein